MKICDYRKEYTNIRWKIRKKTDRNVCLKNNGTLLLSRLAQTTTIIVYSEFYTVVQKKTKTTHIQQTTNL